MPCSRRQNTNADIRGNIMMGDGAYKTLCKSCHGMGGTITPF